MEERLINANPALIVQKLYQIKAEQDGRDVAVVTHAVKRTVEAITDEVTKRKSCWPPVAVGKEIPA